MPLAQKFQAAASGDRAGIVAEAETAAEGVAGEHPAAAGQLMVERANAAAACNGEPTSVQCPALPVQRTTRTMPCIRMRSIRIADSALLLRLRTNRLPVFLQLTTRPTRPCTFAT